MMIRVLLLLTLLTSCIFADIKIKYFNWGDYDKSKLQYNKTLGYTHVQCWLYFQENLYSHSTGKWIYNNGNYTTGDEVDKFKTALKDIRDAGLIPIPQFAVFSHTKHLADKDNTLNPSERTYAQFNASYPKPVLTTLFQIKSKFPCANAWSAQTDAYFVEVCEHVAYPGALGENKAADEFFQEQLKIVKNNWGTGTPEHIFIDHDEFGVECVSLVKVGRSAGRSQSESELVAMEIDARVQQINSIFGSTPKVILYADCFVPNDYGETYKTAGDLSTGVGGVLNLLDTRYNLRSRIVLVPWKYSYCDGRFDTGRNLTINKLNEIAYIDKMKYNYFPLTGDDSDNFENVKRNTFEYIRHSLHYPNYLIGFGTSTWGPYVGSTIQDGYSAPILAYLAWTYGERSLNLVRFNSYTPRIFSKLDFLKSRNERTWIEGIHYSRPPMEGVLQCITKTVHN
jgi:hypothetical protein